MLGPVLLLFTGLLLSGVPIVVALAIPALLYAWIKGLPASLMAYSMFQSLHSFPLLASPLYILMGNLINEFGDTEKLFNFARILLRKTRGYTAKVNVIVSLIFAGISGAAVADIAGLGQIENKAMEGEGFDVRYAAALSGATSVVGPIFPPSIPLVIYAATAEISTLSALLAGIVPAVLITAALYAFVSIQIPRKLIHKPLFESAGGKTDPTLPQVTKEALHLLILVPGVIFAMLFGIFSPSEAGAAAVIYVVVVQTLRGKMRWSILKKSLIDSFRMTANVFLVIACASFFTKVMTLERFPEMITQWFLNVSGSRVVVLLLINILVLIVGMFMETVSSLIILTPILLTITRPLGVDPVHLGVILVYNLTIGMLTPPFGVGVFAAAAVTDTSPDDVFREMMPLYIPLLAALFIITHVPALALWLPGLVK